VSRCHTYTLPSTILSASINDNNCQPTFATTRNKSAIDSSETTPDHMFALMLTRKRPHLSLQVDIPQINFL
jgi:hypothetical protein